MSDNNTIRYCLNCNNKLSDISITEYGLFCDFQCRHAYSVKQYKEFEKNYKPVLTYTDIDTTNTEKKILQSENDSRQELTERYTND